MAYNNIEDFLKGDPANYNFEFECDVQEYIQLPTFDRYLTYKATDPKGKNSAYDSGKQFATEIIQSGKYSELGDCDGSGEKGNVNLIHDIYLKLWKWEKGIDTFGDIQGDDFKCQFGGETMNSMQTILNDVVKNIVYKDENVHLLNKKIGNVSINYMLGLYGDDECKQDFINKVDSIEYISEYANCYHTIGDFVLVPRGFNRWRGFNGKIKDYWHLSLGILKERGWEDNFNFEGNTIEDYYRYINYFYLWDYVDLFGNYIDLLQSDNDNKKYFSKTVIKFIKRRSIFIVTMLRLQLILGEVAYIKLRNDLFLKNDGVYDDYDEVILKIKNHCKGDELEEIIQLLDNAQKDIEEYQR